MRDKFGASVSAVVQRNKRLYTLFCDYENVSEAQFAYVRHSLISWQRENVCSTPCWEMVVGCLCTDDEGGDHLESLLQPPLHLQETAQRCSVLQPVLATGVGTCDFNVTCQV